MWEVECLDVVNNIYFKKEFDNEYKFNKFLNKCKYSHNIKIISWWKL